MIWRLYGRDEDGRYEFDCMGRTKDGRFTTLLDSTRIEPRVFWGLRSRQPVPLSKES